VTVDGLELGATTRRRILQRGVAALAATTAPPLIAATSAIARTETDADALRAALAIEQVVVFSYQHVLRAVSLAAGTAQLVSRFAGHEMAHAATLTAALRRLGGTPPAAPADVKAADRMFDARDFSQRLGDVHTEKDAVDFLFGLEGLAEGAYFVAISKLHDAQLLRTAAQIMGNEGQHAALLGLLKHPGDAVKAVPNALVEGQH
jgi:rubrerythrin